MRRVRADEPAGDEPAKHLARAACAHAAHLRAARRAAGAGAARHPGRSRPLLPVDRIIPHVFCDGSSEKSDPCSAVFLRYEIL